MAFIFTSLPLNFYTSVSGCGCGFGFEQNYWRIDGFGGKKTRIGGFAYPYSPPSIKEQGRLTMVKIDTYNKPATNEKKLRLNFSR